MPTGYTSALYEGKDVGFADFTMNCARAFGALMDLRDEPVDSPIPEVVEPSSFYTEGLEKASAKVASINAWGHAEANELALLDYMQAIRSHTDWLVKSSARLLRYAEMLVCVKAWIPPTSEHQGLKDFMVEQLEGSIKHDCSTDHGSIPKCVSGEDYRSAMLETALRNVQYYTEQGEDDVRRAQEKTDWIHALRQSLVESADTVLLD